MPEQTQAEYYRQAIQLAFCQPKVEGMFLFHAVDEKALAAWQSGLYYADGTPKTSLAAGARVDGPVAARRRRPLPRDAARGPTRGRPARRGADAECDLDCSYVAQLYRLPGKLLATTPRDRRRRPRDRD